MQGNQIVSTRIPGTSSKHVLALFRLNSIGNIFSWVWLVLNMMSLLGCGVFNQAVSAGDAEKMPEVTLTEADNGRSIMVSLGERVILRLNENPSTGFRWVVDKGDNGIIELSGTDYVQAPGSALGGGGHRVFVFEAKRSGSA